MGIKAMPLKIALPGMQLRVSAYAKPNASPIVTTVLMIAIVRLL